MSEIENKKLEGEIEPLQDDELDTVAGGLFESIFDRCSVENPQCRYRKDLCMSCSHFKKKEERFNFDKTVLIIDYYCGKAQKIMYSDTARYDRNWE